VKNTGNSGPVPNDPRSAALFRRVPVPRRLRVPLASADHHTRAKQPGTAVAAGESLSANDADTPPIALAPVAGTIIGNTRVSLLNGAIVDAIEIEASDAPSVPASPARAEHPRIRLSEFGHWIDRLLHAGVHAWRVGSPDLISQLYQCLSRPIDTVLCCVLDSDPNVPLNLSVAQTDPAALAVGVDLLSKLTGARRVWVAADPATSAGWFAAMDPLIRADGLRLVGLRGDYPQPHPTLLLHSLLRRKLRPGRLPVEKGVLLLDATAAVAIGRCASADLPMLDVPIAIRDHVARQPERSLHIRRHPKRCGDPSRWGLSP
jgi:Na+-translocating ferredoxin:NAD+ oxidoreductase RnfC subunit